MKVAIVETGHFQYALTQSEIFDEAEKLFFVHQHIKDEMLEYNSALCDGTWHVIESLEKGKEEIIDVCNREQVDLLLFSPVFTHYRSLLSIVQQVKCPKVITVHNLNTWINGRFWSLNSYNDRVVMRKVLKACDYIAVEDFIYAHLKNNDTKLFNAYKFLYIPFTLFHEATRKTYVREDDRLKVVLPGGIEKDRRRYEDTITVINYFASIKANISFSFAGRAFGEYGTQVQGKLDAANKTHPGIASYFTERDAIQPDLFRREMETSDLVLSTSTKTFKGTGTTEYIGKTKPTAAIHDMMSFELPGLLPAHLRIPTKLEGSAFNYDGPEQLQNILGDLLEKPGLLDTWKAKAKENSRHFTAAEVKKGLPFFMPGLIPAK